MTTSPQSGTEHADGATEVADNTIALVIHDSPNPKWTPRLLDALRAHRAHATFMLVGTRINEHPELVGRMLAEGHDVGITGCRSGDVKQSPGWQRDLELSLAQQALASAACVHTRLFGRAYDMPADTLGALRRDGYLVVEPAADALSRDQRANPRRGHRPDHRDHPRGLARDVHARRACVDRGARDAGSLVPPALPLVVRDLPVDVETPQQLA
ncbi:peptidoglycan/xylan/chitin deacetylase (PgdA/CDA1 family) [Kibdelosporangium phytohabitans]|nr:peptidoglycan/xylan/chitin deacetylase (PgdA/CDA1 family) [Kibdelosporangium phytohabitans]